LSLPFGRAADIEGEIGNQREKYRSEEVAQNRSITLRQSDRCKKDVSTDREETKRTGEKCAGR